MENTTIPHSPSSAGTTAETTNQCTSHFVRASVLETVILKAIQAVSRYALENEAEFVADLKSIWDESKTKSEDTGQQELEEARKRVAELDAMIQNLYESSMKGVLPERQARRMIQQYDEEQILLERRMEELENQIRQEVGQEGGHRAVSGPGQKVPRLSRADGCHALFLH